MSLEVQGETRIWDSVNTMDLPANGGSGKGNSATESAWLEPIRNHQAAVVMERAGKVR
jgi:hypothetical protein